MVELRAFTLMLTLITSAIVASSATYFGVRYIDAIKDIQLRIHHRGPSPGGALVLQILGGGRTMAFILLGFGATLLTGALAATVSESDKPFYQMLIAMDVMMVLMSVYAIKRGNDVARILAGAD